MDTPEINFSSIEKKWIERWSNTNLSEAKFDKSKPKFFIIFAYPTVSGFQHIGHMRGFSYTDAISRFKRMRGYNVLFPVGTHASGNSAISFAKKIERKEQTWMDYLIDNGCNKDNIKSMVNPEFFVEYFNNNYVEQWKKFGLLADWNRFTCTIYPDYNKFIQWQFLKLKENNLLIQKPYYGTFCPQCGPVAVDPSETDISKGGNAEKYEYTLLKFKFEDSCLLAATLRPETIYGQTNLWINPSGKYVKLKVNNESWIVSKDCMKKLEFQKDSVEFIEEVSPKFLIGKFAAAPGINREIIILPSRFSDTTIGTGIVTSVPSDAPYDYIALKDLQNNKEECEKYGLSQEQIQKIKLIPIIDSKGFGEFPAKEICEKLKIQSQNDTELLEEATKEIYKVGFHTGLMRENAGKYSSIPVERAKDLVKQDLTSQGLADSLYDLSEEVICRCGAHVIIKKIEEQWFIKYSDSELTSKSQEHAKTMDIYPEEYKRNLPGVLEWFQDRACARLGNWLGTKLPFDKQWTIEPIADSTLYPAYYIVSKYINNKQLEFEQLTEQFFDFVYLSKGTAKDVAKSIKAEESLVQQIHDDFNYWYPLDINLGGKEHQTVHFPVFIMNHVGILNEKFWPKGIFINHWITGKGSKISKSKGGAQPVPEAIEKYSVDGMRLYYAHIGSAHSDVIWDEEVLANYKSIIQRIYLITTECLEFKNKNNISINNWLISQLNNNIKQATEYFDNFLLREFCNIVYFKMYDDLKWYIRRQGDDEKTIRHYLNQWAKLLTPFTPFVAEEIWEKAGSNTLVSAESWPKVEEEKIKTEYSTQELVISSVLEDIRAIKQLLKLETPGEIELIISESWKYEFYTALIQKAKETRNTGDILKSLMQTDLRKYGGEITRLIPKLIDKLPEHVLTQNQELNLLNESKEFLESEFKTQIKIVKAEDLAQPSVSTQSEHSKGELNRENKAKQALPGKPAILMK